MKNPFSNMRAYSGRYSPQTTELTHGLPASGVESSPSVELENFAAEPSSNPRSEGPNRRASSRIRKFLAKLLCITSEDNESTTEVYSPPIVINQVSTSDTAEASASVDVQAVTHPSSAGSVQASVTSPTETPSSSILESVLSDLTKANSTQVAADQEITTHPDKQEVTYPSSTESVQGSVISPIETPSSSALGDSAKKDSTQVATPQEATGLWSRLFGKFRPLKSEKNQVHNVHSPIGKSLPETFDYLEHVLKQTILKDATYVSFDQFDENAMTPIRTINAADQVPSDISHTDPQVRSKVNSPHTQFNVKRPASYPSRQNTLGGYENVSYDVSNYIGDVVMPSELELGDSSTSASSTTQDIKGKSESNIPSLCEGLTSDIEEGLHTLTSLPNLSSQSRPMHRVPRVLDLRSYGRITSSSSLSTEYKTPAGSFSSMNSVDLSTEYETPAESSSIVDAAIPTEHEAPAGPFSSMDSVDLSTEYETPAESSSIVDAAIPTEHETSVESTHTATADLSSACSDVRRAMRKINKPSFSERFKDALSKTYESRRSTTSSSSSTNSEKISADRYKNIRDLFESNSPGNADTSFVKRVSGATGRSRSPSLVSEIVQLFEKKQGTTSDDLPNKSPTDAMHR